MTKKQFDELWNIYIPQIDESSTLIDNGVSPVLAVALEQASETGKSLAVKFDG